MMRAIARRLIDEEYDASDPNAYGAAFRVCNKLQKSLSVLTGAKGFGSLFTRALKRAGDEVPWVNGLILDAKGTLLPPLPEVEAKLSSREAAKGGLAVVVHLLNLLATFVGESLTLRLVQQVWPRAKLNSKTSEMKP